ncbi:UDP-N-acetylmuramoyl-L-alanyl-D-glutamate--2,6-diaminopimelate ligase [Patescibacteria group bacterium]|nr:UDP-N-acetylmuramoyl-L-alanyl-D-glutamate--2,6-diaminopimelate ligase [Patescibacteria group bacterium]MBU4452791.1 UDP-N-acetylmuramoyl-L-alanyl-D-glutamate--2,6-diaminopimelate ligase [Patescibacteria group bacterium]MCG2687878.1 UDP-N-acetylmuramoyl-L-alanyl-D-glutamate--2,6-diaminopimelate ligase [Candidatus Parcubacteria bacterium]
MKTLIKKLIPLNLILLYHYFVAMIATIFYGFPSKKMIVIGVTGTKGKTSAINFIWSSLTAGGYKTGIISTANIRIGEKEFVNKYHMTMPGRFTIQKLLSQMVREGCKYCIVETTSEGIKQHRNTGIYYDIAVFTNLTPEHLQAHDGSFEKYKQMKGKMFMSLSTHKKIINGAKIKKVIIANNDDEHADYYLNFKADQKITFATQNKADAIAKDIIETNNGVDFTVDNAKFKINILGKFNVYNAMPAIIIGRLAKMNDDQINKGLENLMSIPGRMEIIDEGQDFTVIVDYAHEKQSITKVLQTANTMKQQTAKTIILLGAEGGGRDKSKRPIMGELSAKMADHVIVSNVDPYEDDPEEILEDIAQASEKFGKIRGQNLFVIEDRREGIAKALSLANKNDIVLITGKGAEQSIVIDGKKSAWDDRLVVKEELQKLLA